MTARNSAKDSAFARRLDELESRLAFQDDLIESLNQVITRQDREITNMASKLKDLAARFSDLDDSATRDAMLEQEIPPHY